MLTLYNFRLDKVDQEMSHLVLAQISSDCSLHKQYQSPWIHMKSCFNIVHIELDKIQHLMQGANASIHQSAT